MPATSIPVVAEDFLQRNGGILFRNLLGNPSYETGIEGHSIFSSSGTATGPLRVAESMGSSFAAANQVAGATANGALYISGNANSINSFVPVTGKRMAFRGRAKVQSISGGTISNIALTARVMNSSATVLATVSMSGGANSSVNNPTAGTLLDMSGYIDTTAILAAYPTTAYISLMYVVNYTTGVTFDVRTDLQMICEIATTSTTIPPYFDGDSQYANWEGTSHGSTSVIYADAGFPLTPGYTFDTSGAIWVDSKTQLSHLGNNNTFAIVPSITPVGDSQVTIAGFVGDWAAPQYLSACPVRVDATNFLQCRLGWYSSGTVNLQIMKTVAGVEGTLAGSASIATGAVGSRYWLVGSIVGNLATAQYYTTDPALPTSVPASQISYTLTGTDISLFGSGVKSKPMMRGALTNRNWKIDRFDVYEFSRARYWTGVTRPEYKFASRFILPDAAPRALAIFNPNGAGEGPAATWRSFGWYVTEDKSGDISPASIISKVLSGGYKNLIIDFGYAAVQNYHLDVAYQLYNTYGISVFTSGNDTGATVANPIWTGTTQVAGGGANQLYPAVAAVVDHPITKEWGESPHYDGDARTYLAGVRSSAVIVGEFLDKQAGNTRRPAIVAEQHANGARYVHSQPYAWFQNVALCNAMIKWLAKSPRSSIDIVYGDTDNFLSEDEVLAARAAGLVISDNPSVVMPLNFRRFQRLADTLITVD